jgi:hypothetical protein
VNETGPVVVARIQFVVENDGGQVLSFGEGELDVQMVSLMPPTEYAVRYLWPAFLEAANAAKVTLPKLYNDPVVRPFTS